MSTCVSCQAVCPDGATVCSSCGAPQPGSPQAGVAPQPPPAPAGAWETATPVGGLPASTPPATRPEDPPTPPPALPGYATPGTYPPAYPPPGYRPPGDPAPGDQHRGYPAQGYAPQGSPPQGYPVQAYPTPTGPPPGYPPPGYPTPAGPPPGYRPPGYRPPGYPPPGYPAWGAPIAATLPQRRRGGHAVGYLLVAVMVLGAAAFATYELNLVPAFTRQVDRLIRTAGGPGATPGASFVAGDGTPVDGDTFGEPDAGTAAVSEATADHPFIAPDVDRDALDADLKSIEAAFASRNPAAVATWIHPDARAGLGKVFEANADRLDEIATLLATRMPVFVGTEYAEYEVTGNGRKFTVAYQRSGDHWMLVGL